MIINDFKSFKLNRCWGFGGVVEHDAVDVLDLVDDAVGGGGDGLGGQDGDLGRHKVGGGHGAQGDGVVIGALVTHNADTAHVGQRGKGLGRWAMGSLSTSSRQMASASWTIATFSGVTSPMMRMAKPGPGNG